jgi:hypothetical protein
MRDEGIKALQTTFWKKSRVEKFLQKIDKNPKPIFYY